MTRGFGAAFVARAVLVALAAGAARSVAAQSITVTYSAVEGDSVSPAPVISVFAQQVPAELQPSQVRVLISDRSPTDPAFVVLQQPGISAQFILSSPLPSAHRVFLTAQLLDRNGNVSAQHVDTLRVRSWLRLVSPNTATNSLNTRTPTFEWNSPAITLPPGTWDYAVTVFNVGQNRIEQQKVQLSTTSFTFDNPFDACTSFRWSVTARALNGKPSDTITVNSLGTFVIQTPDCPGATSSYQPFPNPFGRGALSDKACFWFDLQRRTTVSLTIYDLRMRKVKRLVPGFLPAVLDSGSYGRQRPGSQSGCDSQLAWDGRDDRGQFVPPGVYISVFQADGKRESRKFLFKGP